MYCSTLTSDNKDHSFNLLLLESFVQIFRMDSPQDLFLPENKIQVVSQQEQIDTSGTAAVTTDTNTHINTKQYDQSRDNMCEELEKNRLHQMLQDSWKAEKAALMDRSKHISSRHSRFGTMFALVSPVLRQHCYTYDMTFIHSCNIV